MESKVNQQQEDLDREQKARKSAQEEANSLQDLISDMEQTIHTLKQDLMDK